jgi:copper(I)-binding protein
MPNKAFFARILASALLIAAALPASAHDYTVGALKIGHPWTRATPAGAKVAGGFLTITNTGTAPDRLLSAAAEPAGLVEIHEMAMDGGVMKMRALPKGLEIRPGETVTLKPGGYHIMFLDIRQRFREGEKVRGELAFEKAGRITVEFNVEAMGAGGGHSGHGGHRH